MIMGIGASALVVESAESARERGIRPICEVLSAFTANSAFHGTRLDIEPSVRSWRTWCARRNRSGHSREELAPKMVFVSHETYTPARGGSASAEVTRFGKSSATPPTNRGREHQGPDWPCHGTGIEDVLAVKAWNGLVPPGANFKEVDPELGD